MDYILANATVFVHGKFMKSNGLSPTVHDSREFPTAHLRADCSVYDLNGCFLKVFPVLLMFMCASQRAGLFVGETIKAAALRQHMAAIRRSPMPNPEPCP